MQDELKPVAWMYQGPAMLEDETIIQDKKCFPIRQAYMPSGWTETPLYAHPPTTKTVDDRGTPVGDHQMVEAVVDSGFTPENIADAEWLVANMPGIRRFHDMATYERAMICHTASRFRQASLTAARAQVEGEIAEWLRAQRVDVPAHGWEFANTIAAGEHRKDAP